MDAGSLLAIITGIMGLAGLIFTAMHFGRDDTKAIVAQQSSVLTDMATLNDELRQTNEALRSEIADLREQVQRLRQS